ncbi:helix-turn-helix domain-containing protein [Seonamhaeicola sp.]|uniref:helix-turn-helix domain-containing protein n=1 Tax=Seonamhaeicola sp. TaxID=1912245 RepID=UPI0035639C8D
MKKEKNKKTVPLSIILKVVCDYYQCEAKEIFKSGRQTDVIKRRQWFHYLARTLNPDYVVSGSQIGSFYSDVTGKIYDHATILHSTKKVKGYIEMYSNYREEELNFILKIRELVDLDSKPVIFSQNNEKLQTCVPMIYKPSLIYQDLCLQSQ